MAIRRDKARGRGADTWSRFQAAFDLAPGDETQVTQQGGALDVSGMNARHRPHDSA
jgi:plasmid maintenance system antidote protein VapI